MKNITVYRYKREDGGITVSPKKPNTEYTIKTRLIADKDYALVNDKGVKVISVDTDKPEEWTEVSAPELWEMPDLDDIIID